MDENTAVAVQVPEGVAALLSALGFAHAAVNNDNAWAAVYSTLGEDDEDAPPESQVLRDNVHGAIDLAMSAAREALVLQSLRTQLGSPEQDAAPAEEAPDSDYYRQYI